MNGTDTLHIFKKGFNYSEDGPGNRLVYHLCGCNLRCPWCANPEGMRTDGKCTVISVEDLVSEAVSCRMMFFDGGGVTFTGGEATMQYEAVSSALTLLQAAGINTCIETNATHPKLPGLFGVLDHLICDLKHHDADSFRSMTGGDLAVIKENIIRAASERFVHIRIPLIGGFNASSEDADAFAAFFGTLDKTRFDVELLPYHEYGKDKWASLGLKYTMHDAFVTADTVRHFTDTFKQHGIRVIST